MELHLCFINDEKAYIEYTLQLPIAEYCKIIIPNPNLPLALTGLYQKPFFTAILLY